MGYEIRERTSEGAIIRAARRDEYFPLATSDESLINEPEIGFDFASDPIRGAALEEARDTGQAAASSRIRLFRETEGQFGFHVYLPVYSVGEGLDTVEDRRASLRGLVLGVFRIPDLVEDAMAIFEPAGIDLRLIDASAVGEDRLLYVYRSRTRDDPTHGAIDPNVGFPRVYVGSMDVAGRTWELRCSAAPFFVRSRARFVPLGVLIAGLAFTGLLGLYLFVQGRQTQEAESAAATLSILNAELDGHRRNLEALVDERTRDLQAVQEELLRKEKLATLGRLTATIGHELRNPLGSIQSSIYALNQRLGEMDPDSVEAFERIDRSIARCDRIINELLDYAAENPHQPQTTDFDAWLAQVLDEQEIPEGVALDRDLTAGAAGASVQIDRGRLRQCVVNLVANAHQAIQSNDARSGAGRITVASRVRDGRLELRFTDDGPGIESEILSRVFEPLFSTRSFGVGLGLPLVREIMVRHGGGAEIETDPGAGATVIIWFPVSEG